MASFALEFFHRYFHFSHAAWKGWARPAALENAWRACPFARRSLKHGFPAAFADARGLHEELQAKEHEAGLRTLEPQDPTYPASLLKYVPPERLPALLYLRGSEIPEESLAASVVGTRAASAAGLRNTRSFAAFLSAHRVKIVSGLALGVDTEAHRANLRIGTVAVLAGEILSVYPRENQPLAEEILAAGGALVSSHPTGQVPLPFLFPQRNEWIAAFGCGLLMVEGSERSGALVSAKCALAMGKAVVALTQDFSTPAGKGAIRLLQEGAVPCGDEEECLRSLFSRLGGIPWREPLNSPQGAFNFSSFQRAVDLPLPEALALLQEGIQTGRLRKLGPDRFLPRNARS